MSCGVRIGGLLACWPDVRFGEGPEKFGVALPEGEFSQVALIAAIGNCHPDYGDLGGGCALRVSGELVCWADPRHGREGEVFEAPSGRFVDVRSMSAGSTDGGWCAVRVDGGVVCWGKGHQGHEVLAASGYVRMVDGYRALDAAGRPGCLGSSRECREHDWGTTLTPPALPTSRQPKHSAEHRHRQQPDELSDPCRRYTPKCA